MKQGKQFKRLWSLTLLLIAMLVPQGAWATDFISEIKIGAAINQGTAKGYLSGYTLIDRDLNYGNGKDSWYIYLGYKTDTDASKAITGIMIVSGESYQSDDYLEGGTKTLSYDGKTWYRSPAQGAADINKKAGGDWLTIFYTRDGNTVNGGKPLVSLSVAEEIGLSGYTYAGLYKDGAFSANGSTNVGAKGAARYITYTTHTHAYTAAFNWADDGKSCTATTNCADCGDTHSNIACTVTSEPKSGSAATCTVMGWTTYTAEVTSNGKDFSATKDVQDIAALGHSYGAGSWSWADDGHSATCTRTCGRTGCTTNTTGHTSSKSVTFGNGITSAQQVNPTCTTMGTTRYTATATVEGTQYSATKDVLDIAALGHSYGAGSWSWADDGHFATCTRTCSRDANHKSSASVTLGNGITSAQQVAPNCTTKGTTRYTATATVVGTQYTSTKDVVDIAALDHDYSQVVDANYLVYPATCTKDAVYHEKCSRCDTHGAEWSATGTALNHDYSQVVDEDYLVSAATCGSDAIYHEKCSRCDTHGAEWSATGTATGNHSYTNNTLTASPIEDGLYAYACDNGCGTHTDDHIIKDFYGEGNHLELTKDGEGNYSTSEDIIINDPASFYSSVDFSSPVDFSAPSVTFNRYFINDGGMWSFIVPFDIPAAQAAELGKFYQYSKHEEGKVYFDDITKIDNADGIVRANTAYFFEPATDFFTSITVDDAEIKATTSMPDATNPSEPGLYGTYSQIDIPVGAYGYAMHDGQSTFVKSGTGNLLRSFRAYLWLGSGASMARALAFFGEEETNGIFDIDAESEHDTPAYGLSGQRVNDGYKGIVIKNGKKTMVR